MPAAVAATPPAIRTYSADATSATAFAKSRRGAIARVSKVPLTPTTKSKSDDLTRRYDEMLALQRKRQASLSLITAQAQAMSRNNAQPEPSAYVASVSPPARAQVLSGRTTSKNRHPSGCGPKKYYAVAKGQSLGIFTTWKDCQRQVHGYSGAHFKGFKRLPDAEAWLEANLSSDEDSDDCSNSDIRRNSLLDDDNLHDNSSSKEGTSSDNG
jgi:hypothetical protein